MKVFGANSVGHHHHDPGQIYIRLKSSLIWVHAVCLEAIDTQHSSDDKTNFVCLGTLRVNFFAYQCCLQITLPSRQRVSSGKGFNLGRS